MAPGRTRFSSVVDLRLLALVSQGLSRGLLAVLVVLGGSLAAEAQFSVYYTGPQPSYIDTARASNSTDNLTVNVNWMGAAQELCFQVSIVSAADTATSLFDLRPVSVTTRNGNTWPTSWSYQFKNFQLAGLAEGELKIRARRYLYESGSNNCGSSQTVVTEGLSQSFFNDKTGPMASLERPLPPEWFDGTTYDYWIRSNRLDNIGLALTRGIAFDANCKEAKLDYIPSNISGNPAGNPARTFLIPCSASVSTVRDLGYTDAGLAPGFYTLRLMTTDKAAHVSTDWFIVKRADMSLSPTAQVVDWSGGNNVNRPKFTLTVPFTMVVSAVFTTEPLPGTSTSKIYVPSSLTTVAEDAISRTITWEWDGILPGTGRIADGVWRYAFYSELPIAGKEIRLLGQSAATFTRTQEFPHHVAADFYPEFGEAIAFSRTPTSIAAIESFVMADYHFDNGCKETPPTACPDPPTFGFGSVIPIRKTLLAKPSGGQGRKHYFGWEGTIRPDSRCAGVAIGDNLVGTYYRGSKTNVCRELWAIIYRDVINGTYLITQNAIGFPPPEPGLLRADPPVFRIGEPAQAEGETAPPLLLRFTMEPPPAGVTASATLEIIDPALPVGSPAPGDPLSERVVFSSTTPVSSSILEKGEYVLRWDGTSSLIGASTPFVAVAGLDYLVARVRVRFDSGSDSLISEPLYATFVVGY